MCKQLKLIIKLFCVFCGLSACSLSGIELSNGSYRSYVADVYQTSRAGDNLKLIATRSAADLSPDHKAESASIELRIFPDITYQQYHGFGASFTESSAWNLATIPVALRRKVLTRLFSPTDGAGFSLTRTHINSSDYSNYHYTYVEKDDEDLSSFSVNEDMKGFSGDENDQVRGIVLEDPGYDLIPMILEAQSVPGADFGIIASPWSPPSWMKTGESAEMTNGSLQPKYYGIWAQYLSMYISAYAALGIDLWGITPQNEPLHAHDARWDSNGWSATEARDFLRDHLGPQLEKDGHLETADLDAGVRVLIYDHNKSVMNEYVGPTYEDPEASQYAWGTAFHWYAASDQDDNNWYQAELARLHATWPDKGMIHTESSIDIDPDDPIGQYWRLSPDYAGEFVPFDTYAYDIITNLNNGTQGYIEWCMILSHEGKPNPYNNFNSAPVLINPVTDAVTYTPLYYLLSHFSKFIRPDARRISIQSDEVPGVIHTAAKNPDGSITIVIFSSNENPFDFTVRLLESTYSIRIAPNAMQTIHLHSR